MDKFIAETLDVRAHEDKVGRRMKPVLSMMLPDPDDMLSIGRYRMCGGLADAYKSVGFDTRDAWIGIRVCDLNKCVANGIVEKIDIIIREEWPHLGVLWWQLKTDETKYGVAISWPLEVDGKMCIMACSIRLFERPKKDVYSELSCAVRFLNAVDTFLPPHLQLQFAKKNLREYLTVDYPRKFLWNSSLFSVKNTFLVIKDPDEDELTQNESQGPAAWSSWNMETQELCDSMKSVWTSLMPPSWVSNINHFCNETSPHSKMKYFRGDSTARSAPASLKDVEVTSTRNVDILSEGRRSEYSNRRFFRRGSVGENALTTRMRVSSWTGYNNGNDDDDDDQREQQHVEQAVESTIFTTNTTNTPQTRTSVTTTKSPHTNTTPNTAPASLENTYVNTNSLNQGCSTMTRMAKSSTPLMDFRSTYEIQEVQGVSPSHTTKGTTIHAPTPHATTTTQNRARMNPVTRSILSEMRRYRRRDLLGKEDLKWEEKALALATMTHTSTGTVLPNEEMRWINWDEASSCYSFPRGRGGYVNNNNLGEKSTSYAPRDNNMVTNNYTTSEQTTKEGGGSWTEIQGRNEHLINPAFIPYRKEYLPVSSIPSTITSDDFSPTHQPYPFGRTTTTTTTTFSTVEVRNWNTMMHHQGDESIMDEPKPKREPPRHRGKHNKEYPVQRQVMTLQDPVKSGCSSSERRATQNKNHRENHGHHMEAKSWSSADRCGAALRHGSPQSFGSTASSRSTHTEAVGKEATHPTTPKRTKKWNSFFQPGDRVQLHSFKTRIWLDGLTATVNRVFNQRLTRGRCRARVQIMYDDTSLGYKKSYPTTIPHANLRHI